MAVRRTISSNETELFAALQTDPSVIPAAAVWFEKEPNEYDGFGETQNKIARSPINAGRMKKKPTIVGYEATSGFNQDLTTENSIQEVESFLFADRINKGDVSTTSVAADGYVVAAGGAVFKTGNIVIVEGVTVNSGNLGVKVLTADGAAAKVNFAGLTAEAGSVLRVRKCGHEFGATVASIAIVGGRPKLLTGAVDATTLGIVPGEIIYINADAAANVFANAVNTGWCRVWKVEANGLTFDKTDNVMVADAGTGKSIRIWFGAVVKNEKDILKQKAFYWAFRRRMGRPDDASNVQQSVATLGNIASEFSLNIPEEDKITYDVSYMARDYQVFADDSNIPNAANIRRVTEADAINSSKDTRRLRVSSYPKFGSGQILPAVMFPAFTELTLEINNNITANKAVGFVGSYSHTPGFFEVMLSATVYFTSVAGLQAIHDNADMSVDVCMAKDNKGIAIDVPLLGASTDGATVEANEPITLEFEGEASEGAKYNPDFTHAILFSFFPYLPNIASV